MRAVERRRKMRLGRGVDKRKQTFVTAAINVNSLIACSLLLENPISNLIIPGLVGSLTACISIRSVVSLTTIVLEAGKPSGSAEENAHSSSSAEGAGAAAGAGVWEAKSKMEGVAC